MNRLRQALTALIALITPIAALAEPTAYYNPSTGNVQIFSDYPGPLDAIGIVSLTGSLGDRNNLLPVPGATMNPEFPVGYTYYNFPGGLYDTGNTVIIGTPVSDLRLEWTNNIGPVNQGLVIQIPEPRSLTLAAAALLLAAAQFIRRRAFSFFCPDESILARRKASAAETRKI